MTDSVTFEYQYYNDELDEFEETEVTVRFDYRPAQTYGQPDNWCPEELTVMSIKYDDSIPFLEESDIEDFFFENFDTLTDY